VGASQRGRLLAAAISLAGEQGPGAVTVRGLSAAAGISTGTFYSHFPTVDQCMAAAVDWASSRALAVGADSDGQPGDDRRDLGKQLRSVLDWATREQRQSRLLLVDCYGDGGALADERRRAERRFENMLGESLGLPVGHVNPRLRGAVAGLTHAARAQLLAGDVPEPPTLASELERWVLTVCETSAVPELLTADPTDPSSPTREPPPKCPVEVGDERGRVLDAVTKLAVLHGYPSLTGPQIRAQAGVVRRRFDLLFPSLEQCFLEAIERLVLSQVAEAERTSMGADGWLASVVRASAVMCRELARQPPVAQLSLVEILAAGPAGLLCREKLVTELAERLQSRAPPGWQSSRLEATASVAAVWRILESEVFGGRERRLPLLAPTVAQILVAPVYARRRAAGDN
jgi:AcrR family transcriptional regulator